MIHSRKRLLDILRDSKRAAAALVELCESFEKPFSQSSEDCRELWFFFHCNALKAILPKAASAEIYGGKGTITRDTIMSQVSASDEAMVLTIFMAKHSEVLEEVKGGGVSGLSTSDTEQTGTSSGGKKKRSGQGQGGGRRKKPRGSNGKILEGGFEQELGKHRIVYGQFYAKIVKLRTKTAHNDDVNGWYQAIVERIETVAKNQEELEEKLGDSTEPMMAALGALTEKPETDGLFGLELNPVAEAMLAGGSIAL